MTKIDLITGFLGSGKTTFIKEYVSYLKSKGQNVCIIENDFGAINIDLLLVSNLGVDLEMVIGGDKECHKRRLKTKLISLIHKAYDRIIIEPSGIYDTDEFFDLMYEDVILENYEIGNVFCLYDINMTNLSKEEAYLFVSESSNCSKLVVSKRDNRDISINLDYINFLYKEFNSNRIISENDIVYTDNLIFDNIINSGYFSANYLKNNLISDEFETLYIMDKDITLSKLDSIKNEIFDSKYGTIFRVKGFIYDDKYYELNLTLKDKEIKESNVGQKVIIVIGKNLNKEYINKLFG